MKNSQPGLTEPFEIKMIDVQVDCDRHGSQVVQRIHSIGGEVFKGRREEGCPVCSKEARDRKEAEQKEAERQQAIDRRVEAACIPRRYERITFADFKTATPAQQRALELTKSFAGAVVESRHNGDWLVHSGLTGTAKTLLLSASARYLAEQGVSVLYTTQSEIARDFRRTYQRNSDTSEPDLFDYLARKSVLIIDEVGASTSEHIDRLLFEICDARYCARLPTIFATNHPRKDLAAVIGERLYDRMCEVATFVSFDWPSARASARKASASQPSPTQRTA